MDRSTLELPPCKLFAVPLALQKKALFRGGDKGEKVPRKGEEEGWPAKGAKRKKGRVKTGQLLREKLAMLHQLDLHKLELPRLSWLKLLAFVLLQKGKLPAA